MTDWLTSRGSHSSLTVCPADKKKQVWSCFIGVEVEGMATAVALVVDEEFRGLIPPPSDEELSQLEANLAAEGCRDALVAWGGVLIDGHNRLGICERLGIGYEVKELEFSTRGDVKAWIIRNQLGRRNLTPYVRAELALKLEPLIREKARRSYEENVGRPPKSGQKSAPISEKVKTREEVARAARVSHDTIAKTKVIAEKAPEPVKEKLRKGETTINKVYKDIKKREAKEVVAGRIASEPPPLPGGPFRVLVADPPWQYEGRAEDATHRAANPYPSMSLDAIKALPVGDISHEDCILWLWTTNAHMREAFEVLDAWGFTHKTILTWVKDRMGTGDWLRGQTEHCLMAVRGRPTVRLTNQTTVIRGPLREHSRKPEEFYSLVEGLCPGSKAELFAREAREGWGQHGVEIGKFLPDA